MRLASIVAAESQFDEESSYAESGVTGLTEGNESVVTELAEPVTVFENGVTMAWGNFEEGR